MASLRAAGAEARRFRATIRRLVVLACTLPLSGCFTMMTIAVDEGCSNLIYSGTRASLIDHHGGIVDLPFSLVADTVVLPFTIPATLIDTCDPAESPAEAKAIAARHVARQDLLGEVPMADGSGPHNQQFGLGAQP